MGIDRKGIDPQNLPKDIGTLQALVTGLLEAVDEKERDLIRLQHMLEKLLRWRYGPSRERVDENQLFLWAVDELGGSPVPAAPGAEEERESGPIAPQQKRNGHGRRRPPKHMERRRVVHDLDPKERRCPSCGGHLCHIGEELSERLEYIPASLHVIEDVCQKYGCANGCTVVTAAKPMRPIEKSVAGSGLLAHVAVSKYGDHLPLYRQESIFERQGVSISRQTMCDWMRGCAEVVSPLYERMKARVLSSKVMQTDDTPVGVLDPERVRTRTGRIWTYVGDRENPYTIYDYTPTRSRDGPDEFMKDYHGYLQADAYSGYDAMYKDPQRAVTEVGCWAHVRRKYYEARSSDLMRSMIMLAYIRLLYDVEREARERKMGREERRALRQEKSVPILNDIKAYLDREQIKVLPKSPEGHAIAYTLSNWAALIRFCEYGALDIDNNGAERSLRGVVIGRKNWLFFGSDTGGRTAAILTSLIASCKRLHIDPFAYLRDIFDRISAHPSNRIEELLPDNWKAAQQPANPVNA